MVKIKVSQTEFMRNIYQLVDTEHSFSSHPHNIKKPFFGEVTAQSFKIKDTPTLIYRDATIIIQGKFHKDQLNFSTKPNHLFLSTIFFFLLFLLTIIFLATDKGKFAVIGFSTIAFSVIYMMLPYIINRNRFINFLKKISCDKEIYISPGKKKKYRSQKPT